MLAIEIAFIAFMVLEGAGYIVDLVHLGGQEQQKVWSEAKQIYEYTKGDNSLLMLLFGVATCFLVAAFIIFWRGSVKSAYKMQCLSEAGKKIPTFKEDIKSLFDQRSASYTSYTANSWHTNFHSSPTCIHDLYGIYKL